eukprot:7552602-Alexandrium_andersonii.AAC.1
MFPRHHGTQIAAVSHSGPRSSGLLGRGPPGLCGRHQHSVGWLVARRRWPLARGNSLGPPGPQAIVHDCLRVQMCL